MTNLLSRRGALRNLAGIAAATFASAQAAPPPTSVTTDVPHFGNGKPKTCVPLVRQRIRAVMNGSSVARFEDQPPASNRPCK
jgi:hypothetical protein